MQTVVIVIHLMIVSVMIGAVLLQKSEGGGLGMGGGATGSEGTAFTIKQGGYAGRHLPSCLRTSHQSFDIASIFTSPTARKNVRQALRFVLRIASVGLKVESHGAVHIHHRRRGFF